LRRVSALVTLCLLTSAATAYAECAWLLWSAKTNLLSAHETRQACETYRTMELGFAAVARGEKVSPDILKSTQLECHPDPPITATPSECNWMLWTYVPMPKPDKTAFATKQECETARDDANRTIAKVGESAFVCGESDTSGPQQQHASACLLMRTGVTPSLAGTFKTYQQCQRGRGPEVMKREDRGVAFCLPDTVDPRGPSEEHIDCCTCRAASDRHNSHRHGRRR